MSDGPRTRVPVWTIGTEPAQAERLGPLLGSSSQLTPRRLAELRNALAAFDAALRCDGPLGCVRRRLRSAVTSCTSTRSIRLRCSCAGSLGT